MSSVSSDPSAPAVAPAPVPAPGPGGGPAPRVPLFSAEAWAPLKVELFRSLYIATSIAQIGTWAREAGSPSLMMVLTQGWHNQADMAGRIILYSNLPICLFSVFAGALADVLDRRRLLVWTNVWMIVVSVVLGFLTLGGHVSPWGLLGLTFLLGLGTAVTGPALQAVLPELVPPKDMALAINLNSVALNVARALGPASFILVVWVVGAFSDKARAHPFQGIGASYLLSALTFAGAVWVLARWRRPPQRAAVHGEAVWGAIRAGFLYTVHSPANRAILLRVVAFIVPAVTLWSQVPVIAQDQLGMTKTPASYALLYAFVGLGAILGVLLMPGLHKRYKIDPVVNGCTLLFALGLVALAYTHHLWLAIPVLVFLGVNWVIIPTNFNTATQKSVPPWVKGRAISFYLTVLFGSFAIGGALWGKVTTAAAGGIHTTLLVGGVSMMALLALAKWFPLTLNEGLDLAPAFKPGAAPDPYAGLEASPARRPPEPVAGPIRVDVEYAVDPARRAEFAALLQQIGRQRRRNGASHWRVESPVSADDPAPFREVFHFPSPAEHTRQGGRLTKADLALLDQARSFHVGADLPAVGHAPSDLKPLAARALAWSRPRLEYGLVRSFEEIGIAIERFRARRREEPALFIAEGGRRPPTRQ